MPRSRQLLLMVASAIVIVGGVIAFGATGDETSAGDAARSAETYTAASRAAVPAVEAGADLIDVREQAEWDERRATPARLFSLGRLEGGELPQLAKDAKVFVYCHSGRRAGIAVGLLRRAGFSDVTNIGGLSHWKSAGGAVTPS